MIGVIPPLLNIETIAKGRGIRELKRLVRSYGKGNWLKKKGFGRARLNLVLSSTQKFTGMKLMASAKSNTKSSASSSSPRRICSQVGRGPGSEFFVIRR